MKILSLAVAALFTVQCLTFADEASHRAAALELIELSKTRETMRIGFVSAVEPNIDALAKAGLAPTAVDEVRTAVSEWFDREIKFEEMQPKFVEIYMKEFSEPELQEILAFYKTPAGGKMLEKMPSILEQASVIGQEHVAGKKDALQKQIEAVLAKHLKAK